MSGTTSSFLFASAPAPGRRACALLRKSNKPGEDNLSLAVQLDAIIRHIRSEGLRFDSKTDVVTQVVSGWKKTANREAIAELVDLTLTGRYDVIVVYKVDRFGRRVVEVAPYFERMAEQGVQLASVREGNFDLTDPVRLAYAQSLIVQAQQESGVTSSRVLDNRSYKRARGYWQGGTPYGWEIDCMVASTGDRLFQRAPNGSKRLRRKAGEADVVDAVLRMARVDLYSSPRIAKQLNADGIPSPKGSAWTAQQVLRMLTNPVLAGCVTEYDRDPKTDRPLSWSVHPTLDENGEPFLIHEPAISYPEYQLLHARFGLRNVSTRERSGRALLTGLLRCANHPADTGAVCGGKLTGSTNPVAVHKYHCPHSNNPRRCPGNSVTQLPLERYITALFIALISGGDFARRHSGLVAAAAAASGTGDTDHGVVEIATLTELAAAYKQAGENAQTAAAILSASHNYDQTMTKIDTLTRARAGPTTREPAAPVTAFVDLDENACAAMFDTANRDQQRRWLASVIDRIELLPAAGRGAVKGAFGSRGFDPRRARIFLRHDPETAIVAPDDWVGDASDFGGPINCPDCDKPCQNKAGLAAHLRWAHGQVSVAKQRRGQQAVVYPCPEPRCGREFFQPAVIRNHLWTAHKLTDGYPCPKPRCDRTFALPAGVARHLSTVHGTEREFCDICGHTFKPSGLALHKRRTHP